MSEIITTESRYLSPGEILWVLAGRQTVVLDDIDLAVITGTHQPGPDEPADWPFTPGEILVLGSNGKELVGGRRLEPWNTSAVWHTNRLHQAVALSDLITAGATRGMYEWDGALWYRSRDQAAGHRQWCSILSEFGAFIGDTDSINTYGYDIAWPGTYTWPTPTEEA